MFDSSIGFEVELHEKAVTSNYLRITLNPSFFYEAPYRYFIKED